MKNAALWIAGGLTLLVGGLALASPKASAPPSKGPSTARPPCSPELAQRANLLLVQANAELATPPGLPVTSAADPAALDAVALEIERCSAPDPIAQNAFVAELRRTATALRTRRASVPAGGPLPGIPGIPTGLPVPAGPGGGTEGAPGAGTNLPPLTRL